MGSEEVLTQFFPTFSRRCLQPELMDAPGLPHGEHVSALQALARVNVLSLTAWRIWREIRDLADTGSGGRPIRILDVACGGGDVLLALKKKAERAGIPLEASGCDTSLTALSHARARARRMELDADFQEMDVTRSPIPSGYDVIVSSLFLHHLDEATAEAALAGMARAAPRVVVQDLVRSPAGYLLAWGTLRLISGSRVARVDGPRSVQAAFRISEVKEMARRARMRGARVVPCWPQRFLLTWRRP